MAHRRCVMLAVVHDLAEASVGDVTPHQGISKEEKERLETVRARLESHFDQARGLNGMVASIK